jgi:hypothetical protein
MSARCHLTVAFVVGCSFLGGCISPFKTTPSVAKPADPDGPIGDPNDPLPRVQAFLKSEGLTATPAKPGEASRLVAAFDNKIVYAPDTTKGGDPMPGLVARLWIFGPDLKEPVAPDGELMVGVWDQSPKENGGSPVLLEVWHIDRETAKKYVRPDMWGVGYSLFLPWQKYNVELKQINVQVRYNGADGRNLVAPSQVLNLDHSATLQRAAERLGLRTDGTKDGALSIKGATTADLTPVGSRPWPDSGLKK